MYTTENALKRQRHRTLAKYSLTQAQFDAMLELQDGACAICSVPFRSTPSIDHNHKTGKVRALLCSGCNIQVGRHENNKSLSYIVSEYLTRYPQ